MFPSCCHSVPSQLNVSTVLLNGPEDDKATIRVLWTVSIIVSVQITLLAYMCLSHSSLISQIGHH